MKKKVEKEATLAQLGTYLTVEASYQLQQCLNSVTSNPAPPTFHPSKSGSQEGQTWLFNSSMPRFKKQAALKQPPLLAFKIEPAVLHTQR